MTGITPQDWKHYELLDCGGFEKLERFASVVLRRPEPQALWNKKLSESEWDKIADITFKQKGSHGGEWQKKNPNLRDKWKLDYDSENISLKFNLSLTAFKHVGIFPEQAANWECIFENISKIKNKTPRFLNLFAYTGGASLAAKCAGADVTHVDSVRQVLGWSRENMESSGLKDIRWVLEDAMKFVKREAKRGNLYDGIILDPPAYGIGANGERWQLEQNINELLIDIAKILSEKHFLILNVYSLGLSAMVVENLLRSNFNIAQNFECSELYLQSQTKIKLPLGIIARYSWL